MRLQLRTRAPRAHSRPIGGAIVCLAVASVAAVLLASRASAQVVDIELRATLFHEPSPTSALTVVHPVVSVAAAPAEWLGIRAAYEADIVSGATEAVKGGRLAAVDVVSGATSFDDTRHVATGGVEWRRDGTTVAASYSYGTESDYRSQSFTVAGSTAFLQRNTELSLAYGRGFDEVCTSDFDQADAPSSRSRLDSSNGCFTNAPNRAVRGIDLDNFQAAWSQAWTPVFSSQLVVTGALQHGFLGNPYRAVVIAPLGDEALENHPENRARGAVALRGKLYVRAIQTALGASVRVYQDTWDLSAQSYELSAERHLFGGLRAQLRARYYTQTGALFFSDDYTGGEPLDGPRGQYWTGDRELSPLNSVLFGGRLAFEREAPGDARWLGVLTGVSASLGLDVLDIELERFTWAGRAPDDTLALTASAGLGAEF